MADQANLNQGKVFAIFGLTQALGYVVGPMIGGALAKPAETFGWRGPGRIFVVYPYFLPCFVGTVIILIVATISIFLLEETNENVRTQTLLPRPSGSEEAQETEPLLGRSPKNDQKEQVLLTKPMIALVVGIFFMCLHAIAFDEGLPVFLASPSTSIPPVGLGFTSSQIARTLSCMGPVLVLAQFVGYPILSRRFSPLSLWQWPTVIFIILYPLFPLLPNLTAPSVARPVLWAALFTLLTGRFVANVVVYTSMAVMVRNQPILSFFTTKISN